MGVTAHVSDHGVVRPGARTHREVDGAESATPRFGDERLAQPVGLAEVGECSKPLALEDAAACRRRPLLVLGRPPVLAHDPPRRFQRGGREACWPERRSRRTTEGISLLGEGRQREDAPPVGLLAQEAADEVILVPAGRDHDHARARFQPCVRDGAIPVPRPLSIGRAVRLLGVLDGIVDDQDVRAATRERPAYARRQHSARVSAGNSGKLPPVSRRAIRPHPHPERRPIAIEQIARLPTPPSREIRLVAGQDHPPVGERPKYHAGK